jgi:hypothetical protein
LPLIITHGWPGSVVEFLKVIGPLADPAGSGESAAFWALGRPVRRAEFVNLRAALFLDGSAGRGGGPGAALALV